MRVFFLSLVIIIMMSSQTSLGAVWNAEAGLEPSQSYSLAWCVSQADTGDTIYLQPGIHKGPITLSGNLFLYGDSSSATAITDIYRPLETQDFTGSIEHLSLISMHPHVPVNVILFMNSTVTLNGVVIHSESLAGEGIRIEGDSEVTIINCDLSWCARHPIIKLISCPNDVSVYNSYWPAGMNAGHPYLIWDKANDPILGAVIY